MKRILSLLLVILLLALAGCDSAVTDSETTGAVMSEQTEVPATSETEAPFKFPEGELYLETEDAFYTHDKSAFVPKHHYPEDDLIICIQNVRDFAAKGDGVTDDSESFRAALDTAYMCGGGAVYAPAGTYLISEQLNIPAGVVLVGDWCSPETEAAGSRGTVILTDYGKGVEDDSDGFIKLALSSAIRNLTICYPSQRVENPTPYAPTVWMPAGSQPTVENVTFINSWRAISMGSAGNSSLATFCNLYITALNEGIYLDESYDIARFEGVHVSPRYWIENQIAPLTDAQADALRDYTFGNTVGIRIMRGDGSGVYDVFFEYCRIGMLCTNSPRGSGCTSGAITLFETRNCDYGLYIENAHAVGTSLTGFRAYADIECTAAVYTGANYLENTRIQDGIIRGHYKNAAKVTGSALLSFISTEFDLEGDGYILSAEKGSISCTGCSFADTNAAQTLSASAGIILQNCSFAKTPAFDLASDGALTRDDSEINLVKVSGYHQYKETLPQPGSKRIMSITKFGAVGDGKTDNTLEVQAALDHMATLGGGIVFIPEGEFLLERPITVPTGVELAGQLGAWCYVASAFDGSCLLLKTGANDPEGSAAINLSEGSGIRGIVAWYPEQDYMNVTPYSYAVRSLGPDCYAVMVDILNPYQYMDFGTNNSTGHYIRNCAGSFIQTGIFAGNNSGEGWIENVHLNQHQPYELPGNGKSGGYDPADFNTVVYDILIHSAEAYIFGYNENEHVIGTFSLGQKIGYKFIEQGGKATSGTFIQPSSDGCANSYTFEQVGNLTLIDSGSVSLGDSIGTYMKAASTLTGTVNVIGGGGFGSPTYCVLIEGGNLNLQSFAYCSMGGDCPMYVIGGDEIKMVSCVVP